ncbi:alcohol dehydrogenase catalytic domain-containing protein [Haloarcula sp. JP-L23]|uniref:alcohol dehydrogenase catalytic domain-containing protein n=1 Tax=Haloarcula sp. JP-L23 TaxID=2716717 RepID=UPI00140F3AB2|nr:alcohol dehydrogenase catalytic domain-containing protein [Haloarcula sp. JP-L23]
MVETMQCLQIEEWGGNLHLADRPIPKAGDGEVLLEVEATSVGLTVSNVVNGDLGSSPDDLPRIPGHEIIGRVRETGAGVSHPEAGALVGSYFYLNCGYCSACRRGNESLCENLDGFVGVDTDGGFAEYVRLPAGNLLELPERLDPVAATVVPDALATPYHVADQRANVAPGDEVLVLGAAGDVGIHLVQVAQYFGGEVTAVDRGEDGLERCRELGAKRTVDTARQTLSAALDGDAGFDSVVDFTGSMELLAEATELLGPRGRLVNLTTFPGQTFDVSPRAQVFRETEVVGSRYCSKHEFARSAELVAEGTIEPVVSEVVEMDETGRLLERIRAGDIVGRAAMVPE